MSKIQLDFHETFEDDMIELVTSEDNLNLWWDKRLFDFSFQSLKYSKHVPELINEFNLLFGRINIFKMFPKNVADLQIEYLDLTKNIKMMYIKKDYSEIKWKADFIKLRYNDLFLDYKRWLIDEMVCKMKQEKPEWKNILGLILKKE